MKKWKFWLLTAVILSFSGCMKTEEAGEQEQAEDIQKEDAGQDNFAEEPDYSQELPEDYEGTLTMWGWDDIYYKTIAEAFQKKYPGVSIEYTAVENGDLYQRYENALRTGGELPDIGWAMLPYRAEIYELDMWENLAEEPYNFKLTEVYDYVRPLLTDSKGQVCGLEQSLCTAGLAYRRDLTKEYLGTDDPEELEAMFPTWEAFAEKGQEIYENTGGEVCMWPGIADAQSFIREQKDEAWIQGNEIKVTEALGESIETVCLLRDTHTVDTMEAWTPEWYEAIGEGKYLFIACAPWTVAFQIETYDPEGETSGHWGLMSAPEGNIWWGGTAMGITKTCQDKRLAWEFIRFAALSTDGARALRSIGLFTTAVAPYAEALELSSFQNPWFGEQDIGNYFLQHIAPEVHIRKHTMGESQIHDSLNLMNTALRQDPQMTAEEAVKYLKEDLQERFPSYKIE